MAPGTRAAASRERTNDNDAPPASNKRRCTTQAQRQAETRKLGLTRDLESLKEVKRLTCPSEDVLCYLFELGSAKKTFKISATELDRLLGGEVDNFSIAVGPVAMVGAVNVYWNPKDLTLKMTGTYSTSLRTRYGTNNLPYIPFDPWDDEEF